MPQISAIARVMNRRADSVHFFAGNNGWSGPDEKADARWRFGPFVVRGLLDADTAAGFMHARGVHERGVRRIREIVQQLAGRR